MLSHLSLTRDPAQRSVAPVVELFSWMKANTVLVLGLSEQILRVTFPFRVWSLSPDQVLDVILIIGVDNKTEPSL